MSKLRSHSKYNPNALSRQGKLTLAGYLIYGVAFLSTLFTLVYPIVVNHASITIPCSFKRILGIPCPGCGYTRALHQVMEQNWPESFLYNPLWPFIVFFLLLIISVSLKTLLNGKLSSISRKTLLFIVVGFALSWVLKFIIGPSYY